MKIKNLIILAVGFVAGAGAATLYLKDRYAKYAQEEIDSVKEAYGKAPRDREPEENEEKAEPVIAQARKNEDKPDIKTYEKIIESENYTDYSNMKKRAEESDKEAGRTPSTKKPYVITPQQYGDVEEYDIIEFQYYADEVLTDDGDEPITEHIDDIVGEDFADHFGEYEDDSVYIRNERLKADYCIIKNLDDYYPR